MRVDSLFSPVEALIAEGKFQEANERFRACHAQLVRADRSLASAIDSELALELGPLEHALSQAQELLTGTVATVDVRARAYRIAAKAALACGRIAESEQYLRDGTELCRQHHLTVDLANLKISCLNNLIQTRPLEAVFSFLVEARRAVVRAAQPHMLVELHLRVAQCEARRRAPLQALRHFSAAERLLEAYPNVGLSAVLYLDKSNVAALMGDLAAALGAARRAFDLAKESGQFRIQLGAAINASHFLCWLGELEKARESLEIAFGPSRGNVHLRRGALDALANVEIDSLDYTSAAETLAELRSASDSAVAGGYPFHWDTLSVLYSGARLAQALGEWSDAAALLAQGALTAEKCGDRIWNTRMNLARVICLGRSGTYQVTDDGVTAAVSSDLTDELELIGLRWAALAALEPVEARSLQHLRRAVRLATSISHVSLRKDLLIGRSTGDMTALDGARPPVNLDTAVALIELGPYTHVLGPEALAVIDGAGCARAAALVAIGARGSRVIDARGWDERAALAALKKADGCEVIPLGEYHDEAWSIVVDPRPELDQRCTLIAIRKLIATALSLDHYRRDEQQRAALWPAETLDGDPGVIWASEQSTELLTIARRIAPTPLSVLLTGETGTGKEMLAQTIHKASDRADRIFLPFNCTAVARDMLDSQLFGYRKGAFTGADTSFTGVIRAAAGGTLFLDEIAEIGLDVQPKLLRFLETHEIHPLGEPQPLAVDVRVIAATNANLERLVAEGKFREDLFYRLNVVRLKLSPLRERREEIPPLVQHYLGRFGHEQKKTGLTLTDEVLEYLLLYSWPGNVRQLANEVRRMVAMADAGSPLTPTMLSPEIQASRRTIPATASAEPELRISLDQPLPAAVQALEQSMIRHALRRAQGRVEEAARLLGISRKGLFLKRRRWGLAQPAPAPTPPTPASPAGYAG